MGTTSSALPVPAPRPRARTWLAIALTAAVLAGAVIAGIELSRGGAAPAIAPGDSGIHVVQTVPAAPAPGDRSTVTARHRPMPQFGEAPIVDRGSVSPGHRPMPRIARSAPGAPPAPPGNQCVTVAGRTLC